MGLASIILGVVAFLLTFAGFFIPFLASVGTVLPLVGSALAVVGVVVAYAAPIVALAGIVTGGIGLSRAKQDGQPTGVPVAGLIVSIVAFIPAVLVGLVCGTCSACMSAGTMNPNSGGGFRVYSDGGIIRSHDPSTVPDTGPPQPGQLPPPTGAVIDPAAPDPTADPSAQDPTADPSAQDPAADPGAVPSNAPPPAMPPPPIGDPAEPAPE